MSFSLQFSGVFKSLSIHFPCFESKSILTLKMLGCFNTTLGNIWTNPNVIKKNVTQWLVLSIFYPKLTQQFLESYYDELKVLFLGKPFLDVLDTFLASPFFLHHSFFCTSPHT